MSVGLDPAIDAQAGANAAGRTADAPHRRWRRPAVPALLATVVSMFGAPSAGTAAAGALGGVAMPAQVSQMTAVFARPSYAPGQVAELRVVADATRLTVQPIAAFSSSESAHAPIAGDPAVGPARTVSWRRGGGTVTVPIGWWPSGVYFVRVTGGGGEVLAPLVVRPARLGQATVAVIVPTYTWQAYNRRGGDSWYVCSCVHTVDLTRPYLDGGVPYNFGTYDRGFLQWLARNNVRVDVLADEDLDRIATGAELRRLYRMVVFESHSEYVTSHIFDVTQQYRDLGGHLAFLSANDFFRDVVISGSSMTLIGRWRDLGRPEAALLGAQYLDWYRGVYPSRPYRIVGAHRVPWLFAGTGLSNGGQIPGYYGIEIDATTSASPPGTIVVSTIPDIFPGETAEMTYYTTAAGAEVFDAGTINFGGTAGNPYVAGMLANLWTHMSGVTVPCPPTPTSARTSTTGSSHRLLTRRMRTVRAASPVLTPRPTAARRAAGRQRVPGLPRRGPRRDRARAQGPPRM